LSLPLQLTSNLSIVYQIIAVITPYLVDTKQANLGAKVFFLWGATCTLALLFAFFCVPETKGLSLEQTDRMLEQSTTRTSKGWKPLETFASAGVGLQEGDCWARTSKINHTCPALPAGVDR
jgi:hypothetical protein